MTDTIIRRMLFITIVTVFCGVVFHAPLSVWLGTIFPDNQLLIKSWKELLIGLAMVLVIIQVSRRHMWRELGKDWLIRLAAIYAVLHVVMVPLMWQGTLPAVAGLMINLRFVAFFVVMYVALTLYPQWRRPLLWSGFGAAALSMLFAFLQVTVLPNDVLKHIGYGEDTIMPYLTVDRNDDYVRINGTLRGPNPLGLYATIVATACLAVIVMARKKLAKWRFIGDVWDIGTLGLVALVAVWFSYSRSALIALALALAIVLIVKYGKVISKATWVAVCATALLFAGGLYIAKDTHVVSHVILHEDPNEGNDVNSNDGHWESLVDGTERMIRQPFGAGVGSTGSPSLLGDTPLVIENYYLYVAHEVGWLGLAAFVTLFGMVMQRLWRRRGDWLALAVFASGVGIAVAGIILPVWADDTVAIVWWGLAGIALTTSVVTRRKARHDRTIK